jgi:ChaB/Rho termination factor, N-terminal domain
MPDKHQEAEAMRDDVPATIARSGDKAVRTYKKTLDSAEDSYGDGERAHRAAYSALKHTHEKVGDHWEPKAKKGPSDTRARSGGPNPTGTSAEGVDANASKNHLKDVARRLDISGRSSMTKNQLVNAIKKANRRVSSRNR